MNTILSCELQSRDSCKIGRIERHHTGEGGERNRQGGSADQEVTGVAGGVLRRGGRRRRTAPARTRGGGGWREGPGGPGAHRGAPCGVEEAGETATAEESATAAAAGGGEERGGGGATGRWGSIPRVRRERGGRGSWW